MAVLVRAAGFDGIELNATVHVEPAPITPLLEMIQVMIDVWGADRVGVRIAPFTWLAAHDDIRATPYYDQLLGALAGMEIAWLHVTETLTPDRGDLSTCALGQRIRGAFRGMVIASGLYTPTSAIAAVENRWTDAVGFTPVTGCGDELIGAITVAGVG